MDFPAKCTIGIIKPYKELENREVGNAVARTALFDHELNSLGRTRVDVPQALAEDMAAFFRPGTREQFLEWCQGWVSYNHALLGVDPLYVTFRWTHSQAKIYVVNHFPKGDLNTVPQRLKLEENTKRGIIGTLNSYVAGKHGYQDFTEVNPELLKKWRDDLRTNAANLAVRERAYLASLERADQILGTPIADKKDNAAVTSIKTPPPAPTPVAPAPKPTPAPVAPPPAPKAEVKPLKVPEKPVKKAPTPIISDDDGMGL